MNAKLQSTACPGDDRNADYRRGALVAAHHDVALASIKDVCALVRMSPSWVHDEIRAGRFPQPLRFGPRCSRWTVASIRTWLAERTASPPEGVAAMTSARAKKASDAARRKRTARAATTP